MILIILAISSSTIAYISDNSRLRMSCISRFGFLLCCSLYFLVVGIYCGNILGMKLYDAALDVVPVENFMKINCGSQLEN